MFPFDKYEDLTEAPVSGKRGKKILLYTRNNWDPEHRIAWCWACNRYVEVRRMTEDEFLKLYMARRGVVVREPPPRKRKR